MESIINLAIFLGLLTVGYVVGVRIEKKHFRSLLERERQFLPLPVVGMKRVDFPGPVARAELATGSVVVSNR